VILIDTNVVLELLLGQRRANEARDLLDRVSAGSVEAMITHFSLHAVEVVLNDADLNLRLLRNVQNSLGLSLYDTSIEDEMSATILMKEIERDFDDALQYYVARKTGASAIVSFDSHYDGLDIPRVSPAEASRK
jgi:predicted nucleic acid-binding protein